MLKTLQLYLGRDLAKVTGLSLVAFTLVMTVFAIIEPLRKRGLSGDQVFSLFIFTLPTMVSLTLPIAALFAATIVYGRFSQDNELLASHASGIASVSLLKPGLLLGGVVTIVSLLMSYYVAPEMAKLAQTAVKAGIRGYIYSDFRTEGFMLLDDKFLLSADEVLPDEDTLLGVTMIDISKLRGGTVGQLDNVRLAVASEAVLAFKNVGDDVYITPTFKNLGGNWGGIESSGHEETLSWPVGQAIPNPVIEKPAWYGWDKLHRTLTNPLENESIRQKFEEIKREIGYAWLARDIVRTIRMGQVYDKLGSSEKTCRIEADSAVALEKGEVELKSAQPEKNGQPKRVTVEITSANQRRIFTADRARVVPKWFPMKKVSVVSIELFGDVKINVQEMGATTTAQADGDPSLHASRKSRDKVGGLDMPPHILQRASKINWEQVEAGVEKLTSDPAVRASVKQLKNTYIPQLLRRVLAEIHSRFAYGLSCFLLVSMGAALGLMFKGGQVMSAFTLAVIPASLVIVLVLMGKKIISNPDAPQAFGLAAIWIGVVALLVADVLIHMRLARK